MTTEELTREQLDELRNNYYMDIWYGDDAGQEQEDYSDAFGDLPEWESDISDEALYWRYSGYCFSDDDFGCSAF